MILTPIPTGSLGRIATAVAGCVVLLLSGGALADPSSAQGVLDPNHIHQVVFDARSELAACFSFREQPSHAEKLVMEWTITEDGAVANVTAAKQPKAADSETKRCVTKVIAGLRFNRPQGGSVSVTYPVSFIAQ